MSEKYPHPGHQPVAIDSRICFGIEWYATEKEAEEMGEYYRRNGYTFNGGMFHGMACGRSPSWDRGPDHPKGPAFATTC